MDMQFVVYEVSTEVVMKSSVFWDIMPCSPVNQSKFRRNMSPPSSGLLAVCLMLVSCLAYFSTFKMGDRAQTTGKIYDFISMNFRKCPGS
jgi:hypothetical protein